MTTTLLEVNESFTSKSILSGKIVKPLEWHMTISIKPILIIDTQPYDAALVTHYPELDSLDKICVRVTYDQQVIANVSLSDVFEQDFVFIDDKNVKNHELSFLLSGKTDNHSLIQNGQSITLCAEIGIKIEDVNMSTHFNWLGGNILGSNIPKVVTLQTPIYRWLIDNRYHSVNTYSDAIDYSSHDYFFTPFTKHTVLND